MLSQQYQDNIAIILQKIQEAEAIVVGGAAGQKGGEPRYLLPESCYDYIKTNHLYQ